MPSPPKLYVGFHHDKSWCMGESVQDKSRIQGIEADFLLKVGLKMLKSAGNNNFSDLVSVYPKVFDH